MLKAGRMVRKASGRKEFAGGGHGGARAFELPRLLARPTCVRSQRGRPGPFYVLQAFSSALS
jgi:hypothetical protein